jgi:hypothetical protein
MAFELSIHDDYFTGDQIERLAQLFSKHNEEELAPIIQSVVLASLSEYVEMFLGMGLPSRADEIRQHRLFFLIKYLWKDRIPSEAEVSTLFQLTQSKSRALIEQTTTRFHYALGDQVYNTLRISLKEAVLDEDMHCYKMVTQSDYVVEKLNLIIAKEAPKLEQIKKERNSARTFIIYEDTYDVLKQSLGIEE